MALGQLKYKKLLLSAMKIEGATLVRLKLKLEVTKTR